MMSGSDILYTTIHVIPDWPISDHIIGTSHSDRCSQEACTASEWGVFINSDPLLHCSRLAVYVHGPDGKWL
ncbi:unnamed protein product, partial [Staurois parvus]